MILYFAGSLPSHELGLHLGTTTPDPEDQDTRVDPQGVIHRLLSFAEIDDFKKSFEFWLGEFPLVRDLVMDSGAFSAHTRGTYIDLGKYCEFLQEHSQVISWSISLDVIGDPVKTWENHLEMWRRNIRSVPTFHHGSDLKYLEMMCETSDRICLGGLAGRGRGIQEPFLDQCFSVLVDHWPKKIHLLGMTPPWALMKYPIHSCDASSPIMGGGMGVVSTWTQDKMWNRDWRQYVKETGDFSVADPPHGEGHLRRRIINVRNYQNMAKFITRVWESRGISWDPQQVST